MHCQQQALWKVGWWWAACWICVCGSGSSSSASSSRLLPPVVLPRMVLLSAVLAAHHQSTSRTCAAFFRYRRRRTRTSLAFAQVWKPKRCIFHHHQEKPAMGHNNVIWQHRLDAESLNSNNSNNSNKLGTIQDEILALINNNGGRPINLNSPKQVSRAIFGVGTTNNSTHSCSTSRQVLQMAATGRIAHLNETSRKLASLVLQYRQLVAAATKTTISNKTVLSPQSSASSKTTAASATTLRKSRSFSSAVTLNSVDEDESAIERNGDLVAASAITTATALVSLYDLQVESLFTTTTNKKTSCRIHDYWREPLLQLARPSARSLVSQLNAKICPNGYDPLAAATTMMNTFMDPMRSSSSEVGSSSSSSSSSTAGKRGSFLAFCREQKEKYPDCVILVSAVSL
jgi:hypothetical protein